MKTSRQGVFETNSSTMHSLTIAFGSEKKDLKKIIGSDTLKFGTRNPEEIDKANRNTKKNWAIEIDKTYSWQDRADLLFWKLITTIDQTTQFLMVQDKIRKIFEKRGIKVEFLIEPNITTYLRSVILKVIAFMISFLTGLIPISSFKLSISSFLLI